MKDHASSKPKCNSYESNGDGFIEQEDDDDALSDISNAQTKKSVASRKSKKRRSSPNPFMSNETVVITRPQKNVCKNLSDIIRQWKQWKLGRLHWRKNELEQ